MGIFSDFKNSVKNLRNEVQEFKQNHKMISAAVTEIINSLPGPFAAFGRILWDGLEREDESAEELLETLERIEKTNELYFMQITTNIKKLIDNNATKEQILDVSEQIRVSQKEIVSILDSKLNQILEASLDTKAEVQQLKQKIDELTNIVKALDIPQIIKVREQMLLTGASAS